MNTSLHQPPFLVRLRKQTLNALKRTFWFGPRLMFTSRLTLRNSVFMIAAAVPAILCTTAMTVPAMVYSTPDANTYFHFGRILQSDPASWLPLSIAAICSCLALAVPTERPARPFLQAS